MKDHDDYRPISARRKLLILLLAVATAITVILTLLKTPAGAMQTSPKPNMPDAARCDEGNSHQCVGGKADVIVVPPSANSPKP